MIAAGLDLGRLEEHCLAELERWGVPGVEVVAIRDREVVFAEGFGRRRLDPDLPVTPGTVFAHGSTGKGFTAFLVAALVDEGLLAWDTPVREYVPELRLADPAVADRVTLRDLLSHRSGLARHDLAWIANPGWTRPELVRRLRRLPLGGDLRQAWSYSNLGYILAGHVAEVVTGSSFEELLRGRIFVPLGLRRTYASTAEVQALDDHAEPYREKAGRPVPIPMRPLEGAAPAGGVLSCATDTALWLLLQLGETAPAETHALQMPMPGQADGEFALLGYGLGWCLGTYRGRRLVWHNGGIDGFYTEFLLLPDDGVAVGVCNNGGSVVSAAVARHVADLLLGVEAEDWGARLYEQAHGDAAEPEPSSVAGTSPSHGLEDFAATYVHPGYGELQVTVRDDELRFRLGELDLASAWRHYDTWDLSLATLDEVSFTATFVTDAAGVVSEVLAPLEPAVEPIRLRRRAGPD